MPQWNLTRRDAPPVSNQPSVKRKTRDDDDGGADTIVVDTDDPKRAKTSVDSTTAPPPSDPISPDDAARTAAAFIPFLTTEDLMPPKLPSRNEMEQVLLGLRKQALMSEYFGGGSEAVEA